MTECGFQYQIGFLLLLIIPVKNGSNEQKYGQPGYQEALIAEANNVAMEAAITAIDQAEAADARLVGIVQGVLAVGAKVLAAAVVI